MKQAVRFVFCPAPLSFDPLFLNVFRNRFPMFSSVQCCRSDPIFSDPVFNNSDPDLNPTLICFLMLRKKKFLLWHFLSTCKHLMTLKIKDKKIIWKKLYFR